jgi:hypothetical protein
MEDPPGYHQRKRFKEEVPKLTPQQRCALAAACAQRVMPVLAAYLQDTLVFESAIDLAWRFATDEGFDDAEADRVLGECEKVVAALYEDEETGATLRAANAAIFALDGARKPEASPITASMSEASGAADWNQDQEGDRHIQEETDWQTRALDIALSTPIPTREMFKSIDVEPAWLRAFRAG